MKEINHKDEEGRPLCAEAVGHCFLENLAAPVVRSGGEAFKSYYAVEYGYYGYSSIDPSRSYVETLAKAMDEHCTPGNNWPASDAIRILLGDLGFDVRHVPQADVVAFWTMFPDGLSEFLTLPYMRLTKFNRPHGDFVRVLNNPFFYRDPNAPIGRLAEIAGIGGFRFALDRACFVAAPYVVARELAQLSYACREPGKVDVVAQELMPTIAGAMSDWGVRHG